MPHPASDEQENAELEKLKRTFKKFEKELLADIRWVIPLQIIWSVAVVAVLIATNKPNEFAQFGTVVIVMSIIGIGLLRSRHQRLDELWWALMTDIQIKKLQRMVLDLSHSQRALLKECRGEDYTSKELSELEELAENSGFKRYEHLPFIGLNDDFKLNLTRRRLNIIWKFEIVMLSLGTLQTGYGSYVVNWFHR